MDTSQYQLFSGHPIIQEEDLRLLLRQRALRFKAMPLIVSAASFLVILGIGYLVMNGPSIANIFSKNIRTITASQTSEIVPVLTVATASPVASSQPETPEQAPILPIIKLALPANTLIINDLGVSAPILWDTAYDEKIIGQQLQNGVVHLAGTAKPGQKGMIVISGHSSNYPWAKGSYNSVFASLFKATNEQIIKINYKGQEYSYKIDKIYETKDSDVSVLEDGSKTGIRLVTCSPLGTNLRRLVVVASQTSPDPNLNQAFVQGKFSGSLPEAR